MKTFNQIRESSKKMKIGRIPIEIKKNKNMYDVFIDGDKLDSYKSEAEAVRMAKEFVKQYKG